MDSEIEQDAEQLLQQAIILSLHGVEHPDSVVISSTEPTSSPSTQHAHVGGAKEVQFFASSTQSIVANCMEICGCSEEDAARALQAAGPAGIELALELLMTGGMEAIQARMATFPVPTESASPLTKLVCLVRTDLKMRTGKIAAQVAHGALGAVREASNMAPHLLRRWTESGEATIVLAVASGVELEYLVSLARSKGLVTVLRPSIPNILTPYLYIFSAHHMIVSGAGCGAHPGGSRQSYRGLHWSRVR